MYTTADFDLRKLHISPDYSKSWVLEFALMPWITWQLIRLDLANWWADPFLGFSVFDIFVMGGSNDRT